MGDVACEAGGHGGQDRGTDEGRRLPRLRGVSPRWVYELCRRFDGGRGGRPSSPGRDGPGRVLGGYRSEIEDEIVELRKHLLDQGLDAGAHTIAYHLARRHEAAVPSVATIWRILSRRGFVTPQPQKRPRSSFIRFEAEMPNERWQADITHVKLNDGEEVEILNVIDDHSRLLIASDALQDLQGRRRRRELPRSRCGNGYPA